ncbi:hypothetical protein, partial [Xanthomonas citri]|uniref:hypothetical protein n=1 Tax=Xanthomonas citri TaxID=346 RepID=UPI001CC0AB6E
QTFLRHRVGGAVLQVGLANRTAPECACICKLINGLRSVGWTFFGVITVLFNTINLTSELHYREPEVNDESAC